MKLDEKKFMEMRKGFRKAIKTFPNCLIANCNCNSKEFELKKSCHCLCHFSQMDRITKNKNLSFKERMKFIEKGFETKEHWFEYLKKEQ